MTTAPYVELLAPDLAVGALKRADEKHLGSLEEMIHSALMSHRLLVINYIKEQIAKEPEITGSRLVALLDQASALFLGRKNAILGPAAAEAYVRAYRAAGAGDVPMTTIYALAEQHTRRIGEYFDATSKDALLQGFNSFVNRQLPVRVAADRALDAYGLTPRQMSGYVALDVKKKITSAQPMSAKQMVREYIGRSIRSRLKVFAKQEVHNLDLQAKQTAWLWMQDHGALSAEAEKVWLTAKDEKTCAICGPMHGKRVGVSERFVLPNKIEMWVPGVHPNCRCEVKVVDPIVSKADRWYDDEYKRTSDGRFAVKTQDKPSAFLDNLVGEAQRVRDAEPVIREQEKVRLEPEQKVRLSEDRKVRLSPQRKVRLTPIEHVSLSDKTAEKVSLGREEQTKTRLGMPPLQKLALTEDVARDLVRLKALEKPRNRVFYSPTVKIQSENGKQYPVYTVVTPHELSTYNDYLNANSSIVWSPDEVLIAERAVQRLDEAIMDEYESIKDHTGGMVEMYGEDGNKYHAFIEDDDIFALVEAIASGNANGDPDWTGENTKINLDWYTTEGGVPDYKMPDQITYGELAREWGVNPDNLTFMVLRLDEGHDSSLGRTYQADAPTRNGLESWVTEGDYVLEDTKQRVGTANNRFFFPVFDALPDVEMEEFGDHDE